VTTANGQRHDRWRAVDQDDNVLDILVQSRRQKQAAKKFFRKLLKGLRSVPRVVITAQLKSYGAAKREILSGVDHRQSRYLNNRCAHSQRPPRPRERRRQGGTAPGHAQRLLAASSPLAQHLRPRRHLLKMHGLLEVLGVHHHMVQSHHVHCSLPRAIPCKHGFIRRVPICIVAEASAVGQPGTSPYYAGKQGASTLSTRGHPDDLLQRSGWGGRGVALGLGVAPADGRTVG
jgi:DDE domain